MWLHSNMWTTPQAFQNYDKKNAAFIYRLHKVSILQEHSAIRAYFAVTTSIRYTYTFFFLCCSLMCLSVSFISQFPSFFSLEPVSHRFSLPNIFYGIFRYFFSGPRSNRVFECVQFDVNTKWTGSKNWRTSKRIERARHCDTMICAHYRSDDNTVELAFLFRNTYSVSTSFRFFICMWTQFFLLSFNFSSLNMGPLLILQSIKLIGDKNVLLITEKKSFVRKSIGFRYAIHVIKS